MIKIKHKSVEVLGEYGQHLKRLSAEDRYTRFCYNIRDEQIDQFILRILYDQQDHHLFTASLDGAIIGFGHLAREGNDWELAVSVDSAYQGQGIADKLMSFMIPWAQIHGVNNVFMHCITQNQKIQHLARKHGLKTIDRDGTEVTSRVELPRPTAIEYTSEFLKEQRDIYNQIQVLQRKMIENLNPLVFLREHQID